MKHRISTVAIPLFLSLFCRGLRASDEKTYSLGDLGTLKVTLPDGWTGQSNEQTPPTIELKAPAGKHVSLQITALPDELTDAKLKDAATMIGDHFAEGSTEKKTTLEEIKEKDVHGYVSSFTDNSADPGEFKYVTAGILSCNKKTLAVTLLYNDKTSPDHTAALVMLKSLSIAAAPAAAKELRVQSPDGTWTLVVPGKWMVSEDNKSKDHKSRQLTAMSDDGEMMMTLFLEPADNPTGDAKACRDFYLERMKKNPLPMENLKQDVVGEVATLEYDQGSEGFKEHNLNAYLSHAGVWVDLHVSKPDFNNKTDRALIDEIVKGLKQE